jgi:hypothetical protein
VRVGLKKRLEAVDEAQKAYDDAAQWVGTIGARGDKTRKPYGVQVEALGLRLNAGDGELIGAPRALNDAVAKHLEGVVKGHDLIRAAVFSLHDELIEARRRAKEAAEAMIEEIEKAEAGDDAGGA